MGYESLFKSGLVTPATCWITGAGASYDCISMADSPSGIPLTAQLLSEPDSLETTFGLRFSDDIGELIRAGHLTSATADEAIGINIETTMDELRGLSVGQEIELSAFADRCLEQLVSAIALAVTTYQFTTLSWRGRWPQPFCADGYLWLTTLSWLCPRWSIITLNYDELIDIGFRRIPDSTGRAAPAQFSAWNTIVDAFTTGRSKLQFESGVYLKMHGSLDVFVCTNKACNVFQAPYRILKQVNQEEFRIVRACPPCPQCGSHGIEFLVPPGRHKTSAESAFARCVASIGEQVLTQSDRWLFIGYSFPPYDHDVVSLLRSALKVDRRQNRRLIIVDPNATVIAKRLEAELDHVVEGMDLTFGDFTSQMWDMSGGRPSYLDEG